MDTTVTFVIIGIAAVIALVFLSNLRNERKAHKGKSEKKQENPQNQGLAASMPASDQILLDRIEYKKAKRKERTYLVVGFCCSCVCCLRGTYSYAKNRSWHRTESL